eukprot:jgi/Tetstr1/458212/TSEL_044700.t1
MESDDPTVAAMHLAYAATFDPSVYVRCAPRAGCPRSGHHVFHGAQAGARAATCEFRSPPPPTAPPPGVALPASGAVVRALQRQHAPAAASAAHDAALAETARWCATSDVYRKMPRTPLRGTAVGVCPAARPVLSPLLDRTLAYAHRFPPTDDRSYGRAEGVVCVFAGLLLRPYPSSSPAVVRKLAERRVRLWEAGDAVRAGFSMLTAGRRKLPLCKSCAALASRRGTPPTSVWCPTPLRRSLSLKPYLHPPPTPTDPEYSPAEEPPDLRRAPPSWDGNADEVRRWGEDQRRVLRRAPHLSAGHVDWWRWEHIDHGPGRTFMAPVGESLPGGAGRTAAFLASGTVFALHKDDPAAREERAKTCEPLRVRPLGVGSVLVRLASAHALVHVVVCAVRQTGFLSRMMPPSELDPFLEAVDAANISAAFSLLGLDACD